MSLSQRSICRGAKYAFYCSHGSLDHYSFMKGLPRSVFCKSDTCIWSDSSCNGSGCVVGQGLAAAGKGVDLGCINTNTCQCFCKVGQRICYDIVPSNLQAVGA